MDDCLPVGEEKAREWSGSYLDKSATTEANKYIGRLARENERLISVREAAHGGILDHIFLLRETDYSKVYNHIVCNFDTPPFTFEQWMQDNAVFVTALQDYVSACHEEGVAYFQHETDCTTEEAIRQIWGCNTTSDDDEEEADRANRWYDDGEEVFRLLIDGIRLHGKYKTVLAWCNEFDKVVKAHNESLAVKEEGGGGAQ